jgi:hypothetical protein
VDALANEGQVNDFEWAGERVVLAQEEIGEIEVVDVETAVLHT